jgi:hypothetical protein
MMKANDAKAVEEQPQETKNSSRKLPKPSLAWLIPVVLLVMFGIVIGMIFQSAQHACTLITVAGRYLVDEKGCWERLSAEEDPDNIALSRFGTWAYVNFADGQVVESRTYLPCPKPNVTLPSARHPYFSVFLAEDWDRGDFTRSLGDFKDSDYRKAEELSMSKYESTVIGRFSRCVVLNSQGEARFNGFERPAGFADIYTPMDMYYRFDGRDYQFEVDAETAAKEAMGLKWYVSGSYQKLIRGEVVGEGRPPTLYYLGGFVTIVVVIMVVLAVWKTRRARNAPTIIQLKKGEAPPPNPGKNVIIRPYEPKDGEEGDEKALPLTAETENALFKAGYRALKRGGGFDEEVVAKMAALAAAAEDVRSFGHKVERCQTLLKYGIMTSEEFNDTMAQLERWYQIQAPRV